MALQVGVNSYVSVGEADSYFLTRFGYDHWEPLSNTDKEAALISAASMMNHMCVWYGNKTDPEQPLAFPRNGDTEVPQQIKDAQCEIAYQIVLQGSASPAGTDPVTKVKAGSVELNFDTGSNPPDTLETSYARSLIAPYGECDFGGGSSKVVDLERA